MPNNYAFIDSQNLNLATQNLGWNLDWAKFRAYLRDSFKVETAYLFIGYMPEHQDIYSALQKSGYIVIFKPVTVNRDGDVKGNVDAELVLQAMIDISKYDKAVIVSGDGDFASLVSHLAAKDKLEVVIIPNQRQHSQILKAAAKDKITYLNELRNQLQYKKYGNHSSNNQNQAKPATPQVATAAPQTTPATPEAPKPVPVQAADSRPQTAPTSGAAVSSGRKAESATKPATRTPRQARPPRRRNNAEDNLMQTLEKQADQGPVSS